MLQAYQALQNSQNPFRSLEERLTKFQEEHPDATFCKFEIAKGTDKQELIDIASHFASFGYDVDCQSSSSFTVDWTFAQENRIGKIYIDTGFYRYTQNASFKDK